MVLWLNQMEAYFVRVISSSDSLYQNKINGLIFSDAYEIYPLSFLDPIFFSNLCPASLVQGGHHHCDDSEW